MKSILMSIQPKWCELIASGKITIEIANNDDRRTVAAILVDNGYTVRKARRVKSGARSAQIVLEAEKEK